MHRKPVVLFVGAHVTPEGGSAHGMFVASRQLVASPIRDHVEWRLLDATVPVPLPGWPIRLWLAARRVLVVLAALAFHRIDVVLIFAPFNFGRLLDKLAMCLLGRLFRKRVVLSFRSATRRAERCASLLESIVRATAWSCDAIVCQAEPAAAMLAEIVGSGDRIIVIPNWIDLAPYEPIADARRPTWQSDEPAILFIGRFDENKGILELAEAVAALRTAGRRLRLRYAGAGGAGEKLVEHCRQLAITDCVEILGAVDGEAKLAAFRSTDILVLVSATEGLSNAILEAMACGMAIVASPVGATPTLIADGEGGFLVPPRDAAALAEALNKLLDDPARAYSMGQRNRAVVRARHDIGHLWPSVLTALTGRHVTTDGREARASGSPQS